MSQSDTDLRVARMYQVRRTTMEMLRDRGFDVKPLQPHLSLEEFQRRFPPDALEASAALLDFRADKVDDADATVLVFFIDEPKLRTESARNVISTLDSRQVWHAIIVIRGGMTPNAKKELIENGATRRIEIFREDELVLNITKHVLVPTHTPLTSEQKRAVLRRYKITEMQLPRLKVGDPVARYYGLRPGQVVRIKREEKVSTYNTYRLVV